MSGAIDGREIDALTINGEDGVRVLVFEDGYKICIPAGRTRVTAPGNLPMQIACACSLKVVPQRQEFFIPAGRGCA